MTATAIELRDVHLCYRLAKQRLGSFKEHALHWIRGSLTYEDLWALQGVSLKLGRGEAVGLVGRNGAGWDLAYSQCRPELVGDVHLFSLRA